MIRHVFGIPCCPVHLCQRNAYAEAPTTGKAPQELDPEGKAAIELDQLFKFVIEHVNMRRSEHGQDGSNSSAA
jgi:chromosome partitioning protein